MALTPNAKHCLATAGALKVNHYMHIMHGQFMPVQPQTQGMPQSPLNVLLATAFDQTSYAGSLYKRTLQQKSQQEAGLQDHTVVWLCKKWYVKT
jgi:hypothetical protein